MEQSMRNSRESLDYLWEKWNVFPRTQGLTGFTRFYRYSIATMFPLAHRFSTNPPFQQESSIGWRVKERSCKVSLESRSANTLWFENDFNRIEKK
jgi:hypothetical protein